MIVDVDVDDVDDDVGVDDVDDDDDVGGDERDYGFKSKKNIESLPLWFRC